jgi:hypothetical protein
VVALSELKRIADFVNLKLCHALLDSTSGKLQEGRASAEVATELGVGAAVNPAAETGSVIELLTKAYEHYKQLRHSRMIFFLAAQMAEEYLHAGNYQMAKRFFERIVQPYQKEGWWLVLASVQRSLLTCAIHLGQLHDFVACSVALLSARLSDAAAAAASLRLLLALVRLPPPDDEVAAASSSSSGAGDDGQAPASGHPPFPPIASPIALDVDPAQMLLRCTAMWDEPSLAVGGSTFLHLAVHSNLAVPITPTSARLVSSEAALCCRIVHLAAGGATGGSARVSTDEEGGDGNLDTQADLCLAAGGTLRLKVPFRPGTEGLIVVQQLEIMMGSEPCTISLQLPVTSDSSATEPPQLRVGAPKPTLMIQLERPQPLLVHESALAVVHIRSDDDERLRGSLDLGLHRRKTGSASNAALTTSLCTPADASPQTATPASSSSVSLSSPLAASSAPADELFDAEAVLKGAEAPTPIGSAPPIPIPDVDNRSLASIPLVVKALAPGALCLHAAVAYSKHLPSRGTPVSTSATGDAASGTDFASSRQSSSEFVLQAQAAIEMSTMFLLQEQQNFLRTRELEEVCHSLFLPRQPGFHAASAPLTRARKATHSVRPPSSVACASALRRPAPAAPRHSRRVAAHRLWCRDRDQVPRNDDRASRRRGGGALLRARRDGGGAPIRRRVHLPFPNHRGSRGAGEPGDSLRVLEPRDCLRLRRRAPRA